MPPNMVKEWVNPSPITAICQELKGQRALVGRNFQSSIIGPIGAPAAHVNCRSSLALVSVTPEEYARIAAGG
jgi:hypothetical protein